MRRKQKLTKVSQETKVETQEEIRTFTRAALEDMIRARARQYAVEIIGEETEALCGPRHSRKKSPEAARRGGSEKGSILINGKKERILRPRVRAGGAEIQLETYAKLSDFSELGEMVFQMMLGGLGTRAMGNRLSEYTETLNVSKSKASREFIARSRKAMIELNSRSFKEEEFWALVIDGIHIADEVIVVALGVDLSGKKHFLGISQGSTENSEVVSGLLASIAEREIRFTKKVVAVLDGAKALRKAVVAHFGKDRVEVQRCLIHKKRNVIARLSKEYHSEFSERLTQAYNCNSYSQAKKEMKKVAAWLDRINHNAAESLREGMEELLTLHRIKMPPEMRRSLYTTNTIESSFANPRFQTSRVKRWRKDSDMIKRWAGAVLLDQESRFRRIHGYKAIPKFIIAFCGAKSEKLDKNEAA